MDSISQSAAAVQDLDVFDRLKLEIEKQREVLAPDEVPEFDREVGGGGGDALEKESPESLAILFQ